MNKVILIGRLTKDPDVRYTTNSMAIGKYTLAVDRRFTRDGEQSADFIRCVTFGKTAEFAEKYLRKGTKIAVIGRIQTGSYKDDDGKTVYTTDVIVDEHEFCESKGEVKNEAKSEAKPRKVEDDGFMQADEEDLPWKV